MMHSNRIAPTPANAIIALLESALILIVNEITAEISVTTTAMINWKYMKYSSNEMCGSSIGVPSLAIIEPGANAMHATSTMTAKAIITYKIIFGIKFVLFIAFYLFKPQAVPLLRCCMR